MKTLLLLILCFPVLSYSSIEIGTGYASSHSGRKVTTLALAYTTSNFALSTHSSGVKNDYYYSSSYGVNLFRTKKVGAIMGGVIQAGLGAGLLYSKSAFKDSDDTSESSNSDFLLGPAFRVNWSFLGGFYLNVDATYGLRNFASHLQLNFQDSVSTSIGVRLW